MSNLERERFSTAEQIEEHAIQRELFHARLPLLSAKDFKVYSQLVNNEQKEKKTNVKH